MKSAKRAAIGISTAKAENILVAHTAARILLRRGWRKLNISNSLENMVKNEAKTCGDLPFFLFFKRLQRL